MSAQGLPVKLNLEIKTTSFISHLMEANLLKMSTSSNMDFADYEIILCVKNVGTGVARKIEFGDKDALSFAPYGGEPLENVNLLKHGIDLLAPGDERRHNKPIIPDPQGDLNQLRVTISVTYEDSDGIKHSKPSPLNFADPESLPPQGYSQ